MISGLHIRKLNTREKDLYTVATIVAIGAMVTTIQVEEETKRKLQSFGTKGESYNEIINRIYAMAVKEQLREFLYSDTAIPIDEAITRAKKRWSR